jgi:hypothetical protein
MKINSKPLFTFLLLLGIAAKGYSQTGCGSSYAKGQKFHFTREDAPAITDIEGVGLLTPKELKVVQKQFDIDVNAGIRKGKQYKFDMVISDVQPGENGNIYEFEYATPSAKYHSYNVCSRDTLYGIRSLTGTPMMEGADTVGFFKLGIVQYPLKMAVGDVLPVTTDLNYTFPKNFDMSYKRQVLDYVLSTSSSRAYQGYVHTTTSITEFFKEFTMHLSYTIQFSAPTNTYRYVVGQEDILFGGKTYKAFKIALVLETRVDDVISNIEADEKLVKWTLDFTNNYIKKKANKAAGLRNTGFEWFVPELGAVVQSEILDGNGKSMYKSTLDGID